MKYILIIFIILSFLLRDSIAQDLVNCEKCIIVITNNNESSSIKKDDHLFQCKLNNILNIVYYDSNIVVLEDYFVFDSLELNQKSVIIQQYYCNIIANKYDYNILYHEIIFFKLMEYIPSIICSQNDRQLIDIFFKVIYNKIYSSDETISYTLAKMFTCNPVFVSNEIKNQGKKKQLIIDELYVLDDVLGSYEKINKALIEKVYNELLSR